MPYPQSPSWALLCRGHPSQFFAKSANEKERWYSVKRRPWNTRLKAHLLVLEFWSHFSKRDEFLYQKKTGKLRYRCHRVRPFVRVPLSIFSSKDSSLRTADTFPVVASLPLKNFSEGEKRTPEMRLLFAGYKDSGLNIFVLINSTL